MPFFSKDYEDMVSRGLQALTQNTNITQLSPGSKARFILDAIFQEQAAEHSLFDENLAQAFIRWAEGRFLDYFGDMLNLPRFEANFATAEIDHDNFTFYVDRGVFGDINNQTDFIIPSGTTISTMDFPIEQTTFAQAQGIERQTKVEYDLVNDVLCRTSSSVVYGKIRARVEGSGSNIPRNVLRKHNFSDYTLSSRSLLKCTNKYAISNGRARESDEAYRYRLMNAFKARERANKMAIRLAALSIPGVADVKEVNYEQGPGTMSLYVQSVTPTVGPSLINDVQTAVEHVNAFGTKAYVFSPLLLGLEIVVAVNWKGETTSSEKATGYASIRNNIETFLNSLDIGEKIDLADLASLIVLSSDSIRSIGLVSSGEFEEVYIYRRSANDSGVAKSLFVGSSVEPLYNEKIILETSTKYRGVKFL